MQGLTLLRQARGELQLGGCCFASSKVLEDYSLQGAVSPKLLGDCSFEARVSKLQARVLHQSIGELQLAGAIPVHLIILNTTPPHHISETHPISCRFEHTS